MGRLLALAGQVPDVVLCSPAKRAADTLALAMEAGNWRCRVETAPGLYGDGVDGALAEIRAHGGGVDVLMVVGHEPTSSELAAVIMGGGRIDVPTAAALRLDVDGLDVADVGPDCGTLTWFLIPRLFRSDAFPFAE
jgi:phosphohistidine phosphatase